MQSLRLTAHARASPICNATRVSYDAEALGASSQVSIRESAQLCNERNNIVPSRWPGSLQDGGGNERQGRGDVKQRRVPQQPLEPRQLTAHITNCTSWRDMRTLLHSHAQSMNSIHLSALVTRLAKVVPVNAASGPPAERAALDRFLQDVSALVSRSLDQLDARALANILWAVARLGFRPSYTLLQRYLFAAYLALPNMQGQELANIAWAVACMQIQPGRDWMLRLCRHVSRQAHTMKPQELANVTWAFSRLMPTGADQPDHQSRTQPEPSSGSDLSSHQPYTQPEPSSSQAQPECISARNEQQEGSMENVILRLQQGMERQMIHFKPQELMMMLMALHRLHGLSSHPSSRMVTVADPDSPASGNQPSSSTSSAPSNQQNARAATTTATGSTLGHTGHILNTSPIHPSQRHYSQLLLMSARQLAPQLRWLSGRDACHVSCLVAWDTQRCPGTWASATGRATVRDLCHAVEAHTLPFMTGLGKQGLMRLAWALAELGARPESSWLTAYQASLFQGISSQQQSQTLTPASRSGTSSSAPHIRPVPGCQPAGSTGIALSGLGATSTSRAWDNASLVTGIWALARLQDSHAGTDQLPDEPVELQTQQSCKDGRVTAHKSGSCQVLSADVQAALCLAIPTLGFAQLSRLTWALGKLQPATTARLHRQLLVSLARYIRLHMQLVAYGSIPQKLSQILYPASSTAATTTGAFIATEGQPTVKLLTGNVTAKHLGMLLAGMRSLQLPTQPALLLAMARTAAKITTDQSAASPSTLLSLFWQLLRSDAPCQYRKAVSVKLAAVLATPLAQRVQHLGPCHVYMLVRKLAALGGAQLPTEVRTALVMRMSMGLRDLPPAHMVRALVCVVQLQLQPGPDWVKVCLHLTHGMMGQLSLHDISNVVWSLAKLHVVPPSSWTVECVSTMLHLAHGCTGGASEASHARATVRSLWALQQMSVTAPPLKDKLTQLALAGVHHLSTDEALLLMRVLTASRTMMLRSHWRKLVTACATPGKRAPTWKRASLRSMSSRDMPTQKIAAASGQSRLKRTEGLRSGQARKLARALEKALQAPHMRWAQRWPAWIQIKSQLQWRAWHLSKKQLQSRFKRRENPVCARLQA